MSSCELSAIPAKAAIKGIATEDKTETNIHSSKSIISSKHGKRHLAPAKVKKRAAWACKYCRARKVRCDVVYGSPCRNCRWDKMECSIQETRWQTNHVFVANKVTGAEVQNRPVASVINLNGVAEVPKSTDASIGSFTGLAATKVSNEAAATKEAIKHGVPSLGDQVPPGFKPLPTKVAAEDVRYLRSKGALSVPSVPLQSALLQAYVEYVNPYMPLELFPFLNAINAGDGRAEKVSLLMYQAVMFAATAFVDIELLYDFDCEPNQLVVVQALLLMTYWYETSEDKKGAWHWIGVAISLAYTLCLHRDPSTTSMSSARQKLYKRIWWSCFMRDRLIALGMRQPSRIHDKDFDVPMLEESDFDIEVFPQDDNILPRQCAVVRDLTMQHELADLFIAKVQLCICIGHVLNSMYSDDMRNKVIPENTTNSTSMLLPKKKLDNMECFLSIKLELLAWAEALPPCCRYTPLIRLDIKNSNATIAVQRTLLHMLYYTIDLTLHRPQLLPPSPTQVMTSPSVVQGVSRLHVRNATIYITRMASELHHLGLDRFLPVTGVTVILPAMMMQLLEMRNAAPQARVLAARGFQQCMCVMEQLREIYVAADDIVGFLDAALRKLGVDVNELAAIGVTNQDLEFTETDSGRQTLLAELNLDLAKGSPTPSAVAISKETSFADLTSSIEQEVIDWNTVTGTEIDLGQWLQFPPEEARQQ
ncbi:fungal-specific transcription factor domain-containing protein [Fusarium oxysporum Fo47]|uniref:fungal-specific transcription factor domain-containing protein n=1 Tax=Fusarium oxysporum Fo47 TaxID=660027 RepID=UPI002869C75E|nr:fungal-specific transcription factor domain-containing protein [Fusarium oxysporum Fo47]QKD59042.2 fungal-specific transcription factor domain-domain-containing protein [Fusarium oxysporum Fo47]